MRRRLIRSVVVVLGVAAVVGTAPGAEAGLGGCPCTVTTNADSGAGSFRQAVADANTAVGGDNTITFDPGLHVVLTGPGPTFSDTTGMVIDGNGSTVDGVDAHHIFESTSVAVVTLRDIRLEDGLSGGTGGAVRVGAGGVRFDNATVASSTAALGGGGAQALSGGPIAVIDSTFTGNVTAAGTGGALAGGTSAITVTGSRFSGNTAAAGSGGAILGNAVAVVDSTFTGNDGIDPGGGGAVFASNDIEVANSTFSDNLTTGFGGALRSPAGPLVLHHVTFSGNSATTGAHIQTNGGVDLFGTVFEDPLGGGDNCATPIVVTSSYTYSTDSSCWLDGTGDVADGADPRLGPPRDNGGGHQTMYPLWASLLVDVIPPASCDPTTDPDLSLDQRGIDRPFEAGCDIGAIEQVYPEHAFTDSAAWVEGAIRWITSPVNAVEPIMTGITPTTFKPNDNITRAQVTRLLYREAGSPDTDSYPPHGFTDVPAWVDQAVTWAKAENIMTGITPTLFKPNDPITRAQVVRAKYRLAGEPDVSALPAHPFTDVPAWVTDAVRWAAANSLVTGITPTLFKPNDPITRGQVARTDYRLAINPDAWDDPDTAPPTLPFRPGP